MLEAAPLFRLIHAHVGNTLVNNVKTIYANIGVALVVVFATKAISIGKVMLRYSS